MDISISIIMPLFNKAAFVRNALAALVSQLSPDDELIVVDDCSSDESAALVAGMGFSSVRLLRQSANAGPATARNVGAKVAKGRYLLFFDADDLPSADLLSTLRACIAAHPDEALFAYDLAIEARGERLAGIGAVSAPTRTLERGAFVKSCLDGKPVCTASSTCVRAREFAETGGFMPGLRYCEDPELWARLSARHRLVHIGITLAVYQDVPMSLSYGLRAQPGSVQPYVETLLRLSGGANDAYAQLARSVVTKNIVFGLSMGARRTAIRAYLRSLRTKLPTLHFAMLMTLAFSPRAVVRLPLAIRSWRAKRRLQSGVGSL